MVNFKQNVTEKVIVVTGANTGLGLALVRRFCQEYGDTATVYLTARDQTRGWEAVQQLQKEGLNPQLQLLDVTSEASVQLFAEFIQNMHGGIDILVSNAAARIQPDLSDAEQIENFINTNNHGTYRIIRHFKPLLNDGARFVVVASSFGSLRHLNPTLHTKFDVDNPAYSLQTVEKVMDEYKQAVLDGTAANQGWPAWINVPSKVGQVALMKVFARDMHQEARHRDILINAVCPGLIDTEASRPWFKDMSQAQTPDQAAQDVVWLATLPPQTEEPYAQLLQHRKVLDFS